MKPSDLDQAAARFNGTTRELSRRTSNIRSVYRESKTWAYPVEFVVDPQDGNAITGIERVGGNEYIGYHNGVLTSYSGNYRVWIQSH